MKQTRSVSKPSQREPAGLLRREHRLAGPRGADDLDAPVPLEPPQDADLVLGQLDDRALAVGDLATEQGPKGDRLLEDLLEQVDALRARRLPIAGFAGPQVERLLDGLPGRVGVVDWELGPIEHEVGLDPGPDELEPVAGAGEIDIGQGDGVAGDRAEVARRVGQLRELVHERVHARHRLLERARLELAAAGVPAAVRVALDLARLDLEDEEAPIGMGEHDVGLAIPEPAVLRGPAEPGHIAEETVLRG